jgi:hypothetical protein
VAHQEVAEEADGHVRIVQLADMILEAYQGLYGAGQSRAQHLGKKLQQIAKALRFDPQRMDGLDGCPRHDRLVGPHPAVVVPYLRGQHVSNLLGVRGGVPAALHSGARR